MSLDTALHAAKPIVGVTGVKAGSLRVTSISAMLENQLINVINAAGVFSILNPDLLKDQLTRFGCTDEECALAFARTAGINLIIRGYAEDKGDTIIFNIYSQGIDVPYNGRFVYKYSAEIPVKGLNLSTMEYSLIAEEHAAYFIAGLLRKYNAQLFVRISKSGKQVIDSDEDLKGNFDLYRYEDNPSAGENIRIFKMIGKINVEKKEIRTVSPEAIPIKDNDFIFMTFSKKAEFIENFFNGRKRELVLNEQSLMNTAALVFFTAPASSLMPLIAPLSYYKTGDFTGLSLWALNASPYLYLEYNGLKNRPESYKDDRRDVSRQTIARYRFGIYMLLCGGMPLMIDALSYRTLYLAAGYQGKQPFIGNTLSAVYLSLISGGGGLFYRGYRLEGYIYFHIQNVLLYLTLKEFSAAETYNEQTGSYTKGSINKEKGYAYLGALGLLKLIEITHVLLIKDNIRNGKVLEESFGFEPAVYRDGFGLNFGAQYTLRY